MKIRIDWLGDSYECSHDGCSGGWAEGAVVTLDGVVIHDLTPVAHCYESTSYTQEEVYKRILIGLGYELEET